MKTFSLSLLAFALVASPALAFSVDIILPNLTWPENPATPITQACIDPVQLGTPDCPTPE